MVLSVGGLWTTIALAAQATSPPHQGWQIVHRQFPPARSQFPCRSGISGATRNTPGAAQAARRSGRRVAAKGVAGNKGSSQCMDLRVDANHCIKLLRDRETGSEQGVRRVRYLGMRSRLPQKHWGRQSAISDRTESGLREPIWNATGRDPVRDRPAPLCGERSTRDSRTHCGCASSSSRPSMSRQKIPSSSMSPTNDKPAVATAA
jgi:hypothetical protein